MNKKAVQLAINSIIIIIIAIIVLVMISVAFATGWNTVWDKFTKFSGDEAESAIDNCKVACAKGNEYAYCTKINENVDLNNDGKDDTCKDIAVGDQYLNACTNPAITY